MSLSFRVWCNALCTRCGRPKSTTQKWLNQKCFGKATPSIIQVASFACFSYCPSLIHLHEQSGTCSSLHNAACRGQRRSQSVCISTAQCTKVLSSLRHRYASEVYLLQHVCVSLMQPLTLMHQQPCTVVSGEQTSVLHHNCVHFSRCSPIVSASAAAPRLHPLQLWLVAVHFIYSLLYYKCLSYINWSLYYVGFSLMYFDFY